MLSKNKKKLILTSIVIILPVLIGLVLWNQLPDQVPTHWNANGEIDGWSSKYFAVFIMPLIMLSVHILCKTVTTMDPKNKNITSKPLNLVFWICPVMSIFAGCCTYAAALGIEVNMNTLAPAIIGIIFILIGNYLPKCQQNYTVGIKVPWTLHDENNWNATHRFAGPVWMAGGVSLTILGIFGLELLFAAVLLIIAILPMIYSYLYYKKH
ncbi:MAG: DUF1648 domain-containing protein [Firmicutes bacterium]|nr:DUF1648 domain-containing protein [Bacillota bacterium]